ncbi:hypothetical protein Tco_1094117 [Tanacetum coccineum]|uniref:Uncharacterized protein n=1 Tax=Tanacetum coccineum TaxID=301880 RepID=A0ABQ5IG02_9ASTR
MTEKQKKQKKLKYNSEAQHYTNGGLELIRAKLDANADAFKQSSKETERSKKVMKQRDDESTKKSGKRRKQMARKGMNTNVDENDSEESDKVDEQEED